MFKKFKKFLHKHFGLPTPVELGRSERNSLPMKDFCEPDDYTWESWNKEVKAKYPVRFFFLETFRHWFVVHVTMQVSHFFYWFKSMTYRRYHMLDLRQPKGSYEDYTWGYLDPDRAMLFAMFNILVKHVDYLNESKWHYGPNEETFEKLKQDIIETVSPEEKLLYEEKLKYLKELKALYDYWTIEREEDCKKRDKLLTDWSKHRTDDKVKGDDSRWEALRKAEEELEKTEELMLFRLLSIRGHLWT